MNFVKSHKLHKQQNSSFGLIKIYLALWAWERMPYIVYKLNTDPDSDSKTTQAIL